VARNAAHNPTRTSGSAAAKIARQDTARAAIARHISDSATRTHVGFDDTTPSTIGRRPIRLMPTTAPNAVAAPATAAERRGANRRRRRAVDTVVTIPTLAGSPEARLNAGENGVVRTRPDSVQAHVTSVG